MQKENLVNAYKKFVNSYESEIQIKTSLINRRTFHTPKQNPQHCRFCKKNAPTTTFKTDAHLIPKFLGSKYLLSSYECDECNQKFKLFENDLANFIGVIRSINGITGKSKNPTYFKQNLKVFQEEDKSVMIVNEEIFKEIGNGNRRIKIPAIKNPYTPTNVFKALLKIGMSIISEKDTSDFQNAMEFLTESTSEQHEKIKNAMKIIRVFIPGVIEPKTPNVQLFTRKKHTIEMPEKVLVLHIRNFVFQVALPFNFKDNFLVGKIIDLPLLPIILTDHYKKEFGDMQFEVIDLSGTIQVTNKDDSLELTLKNIKHNKIEEK